jgi:hypothetical protein
MSTGDTGPSPTDANAGGGRQPTEEELRAAYEAEIKKVRVEQIVLEQIVTLINLGMRRTGLTPGTEDERDLAQVRLAIEAIRAQMPLIEQITPEQIGAIRDALSQLQMAYVQLGGTTPGDAQSPAGATAGASAPGVGADGPAPAGDAPSSGPASPGASEPAPDDSSGDAGPAQRSGRLWIPGQ